MPLASLNRLPWDTTRTPALALGQGQPLLMQRGISLGSSTGNPLPLPHRLLIWAVTTCSSLQQADGGKQQKKPQQGSKGICPHMPGPVKDQKGDAQ